MDICPSLGNIVLGILRLLEGNKQVLIVSLDKFPKRILTILRRVKVGGSSVDTLKDKGQLSQSIQVHC